MSVEAKICGINSPEALAAAIDGGARWVGLVFYPPSPRSLRPAAAAALAREAAGRTIRTGLFVDPDDALLEATLAEVQLDLLQLHGAEAPERVRTIRARFGLPVMKAIPVAGPEDIEAAHRWADVVDRLLFDAKPPRDMKDALPGGNALSFDWELLGGTRWPVPWMLSGGLTAENLAEAARISGAPAVDVSSGVEARPGVKDPKKIAEFLRVAASLK